MATASKDVLSETDSEHEPLLGSSAEKRNSYSNRPGYEQRKRVMEAGTFVVSDHGTFLGMRMNSVLEIPDEGEIPPMDNPTTIALNICQERVLKPFQRLIKFVGWQPIFDDADRSWKKFINVFHPIFVMSLILMGYVIQYASCFRRDKAYFSADIDIVTVSPANSSRNHTNGSWWPPCQHFIISQYMIPDILHSIAYLFSFYTVRIKQSEQLPTLIVRVFLQTSPTETGFRSQGNLIRKLRMLLYGSILWVVLSQVAQGMHIGAQYFEINFYWLDPGRSEAGRVMLLIMMCISFIALDIVYIVVVLNYCVQCYLLIFYIEGIMEKLRESRLKLMAVMKEINEMQGHIRVLNLNPGIALSIVMINFGTMGALGFIAIIQQKGEENALMYIATFFAFLLWLAVMALPIIVGSMLTAACNSLRKMGHEIRVRPFGYELDNISDEELNGFLLFMSTLRLKAKIFLIPVRSSYVCALLLILGISMLLLFQTGVLHVWL